MHRRPAHLEVFDPVDRWIHWAALVGGLGSLATGPLVETPGLARAVGVGASAGAVHGVLGIVATLADMACGHASLTLVEEGQGLITVEYKINFVAPGTGDELVARGEVVKAGKRVYVARSDVYGRRDGAETLCATSLATWAVIAR